MSAFAEPVLHECFSLLVALAAAVPRVRLGSLVAGMTYRHPAVLANTHRPVRGGRGRAEAGLDELIVPTFGAVDEARELYSFLQKEILPQVR